MDTFDNYIDLITSANKGQPKYTEMLAAVGAPMFSLQRRTLEAPSLYDIDLAAGAQLDVLGQWIGLGRTLTAPIEGVYFSWNTEGLGWNEGVWRGPFDPETGVVSLDDETYRVFLKSKIAVNNWDGRGSQWRELMSFAFAGTGTVVDYVDNQDMSIDVIVSGVPPSKLMLELMKRGYLSVKPCGVRIGGIFTTSQSGTPVFSWNANNTDTFGGWNSGSWAAAL